MDDLEKRVKLLEKIVSSLGRSNAIPRAIETAFTERLGILVPTGFASAGSTITTSSFPVTIPANPSGALDVVFEGNTYGLLYK